jgi:hypothetical protein
MRWANSSSGHLVDEADDVVEDEDPFDGIPHHLVLRFEPSMITRVQRSMSL